MDRGDEGDEEAHQLLPGLPGDQPPLPLLLQATPRVLPGPIVHL